MLVGFYNLPTVLTFIALVLGMASCMFSFNGYTGYAMVCLIWAGIFDLFDGFVARKFDLSEEEKAFGVQIDSINDAVNFGAAPAMIALHSGFNAPVDYIILTVYCCAASMRLAYFNVTGLTGEGPVKFYTGLPVTFSALIFPLVYLLEFVTAGPVYTLCIRIAYVLAAFFFVLKIPIPKPKGIFYVIFPVLAVIVTALWTVKSI